MPYRLFHSSQHDADMIKVMSEVFDEVCSELRLANREDRLRDLIAHQILACAGQGERDRANLRACARKALLLP